MRTYACTASVLPWGVTWGWDLEDRGTRIDPRAVLLSYTTAAVIPICGVYSLAALVLELPVTHVAAPLVVLAAGVVARVLMRRGQVAWGGIGLLSVAWLGEMAFLLQEGWRSPTMAVFFVIITLAAALIGARGTLVFTCITILALGAAGLAEHRGWIEPHPLTNPTSIALTWLWTLMLTGVVLYTFVRLFHRALEREQAGERRSRSLMLASPDGIATLDAEGRFIEANPALARMMGLSERDIIGRRIDELPFESDAELTSAKDDFAATLDGEPYRPTIHRLRRHDGTLVSIEVNQRALTAEDGFEEARVQAIVRDVTKRLETEEANQELQSQLRHAQRLESVGRLAGGVAHEFNNCLTVILASVDELAAAEGWSPEHRQDLADVRRAALRAADVTTKLLAFGRRRPRGAAVVSVNELLSGLEKMIRRLVGETIRVTMDLAASPDTIWADPTHVEQVVVNLVINAVDAMADRGGDLTIATARYERARERNETEPCEELVITVRDTGAGMSDDVRSRIFEPFFSTKDHGEGTGLGLSLVHGIVAQAGGHIEVSSTVGRGTEFRVRLPLSARPSQPQTPAPRRAAPLGGLRILIVEDEPLVAKSARRILVRAGHEVAIAESAEEALAFEREIDLLLSDVVLPDESGPDLAARLSERQPGLRVLFMSGYDAGHLERHATEGMHLLHKPFDADELLDGIHEVMAVRGDATGADAH